MAAGTHKAIEPLSPQIFQRGTRKIKEALGQTFLKGAPLITSAGYASVYGGGGSVYAIAAEDAHNTAADGDSEVEVFLVAPNDEWIFTLKEAAALATFQAADYGLVEDVATKTWYVSTADVTDEVHVICPAEPIGGLTDVADTVTRVVGRFNAANILFG